MAFLGIPEVFIESIPAIGRRYPGWRVLATKAELPGSVVKQWTPISCCEPQAFGYLISTGLDFGAKARVQKCSGLLSSAT